jgi:hypothetical protein
MPDVEDSAGESPPCLFEDRGTALEGLPEHDEFEVDPLAVNIEKCLKKCLRILVVFPSVVPHDDRRATRPRIHRRIHLREVHPRRNYGGFCAYRVHRVVEAHVPRVPGEVPHASKEGLKVMRGVEGQAVRGEGRCGVRQPEVKVPLVLRLDGVGELVLVVIGQNRHFPYPRRCESPEGGHVEEGGTEHPVVAFP